MQASQMCVFAYLLTSKGILKKTGTSLVLAVHAQPVVSVVLLHSIIGGDSSVLAGLNDVGLELIDLVVSVSHDCVFDSSGNLIGHVESWSLFLSKERIIH